MQYKKKKKIEATRPLLCGEKIRQMVIFFSKRQILFYFEFLSCQISKKKSIKKKPRFYPKFQQVAKI
jgi:hypothetical protein